MWVVLLVVGLIGIVLVISVLLRLFGIDEPSPDADGVRFVVAVLTWLGAYAITTRVAKRKGQDKRKAQPTRLAQHESGRRSRFARLQYIDLAGSCGVQTSMDRTGLAWDNVFVERFWQSLK